MMVKRYYQIYFQFIGLASLAALSGAYFSEFVMGLIPCKFCYYQRYAYWAIIAACLFGLKTENLRKSTFISVIILLGVGIGLSITHVAVESDWLELDLSCTGNIHHKAQTIEEFKAMIEAKDDVPCDVVKFSFMGLTLAGWNFLYSCLLFIISVVLAYVFGGSLERHGKKK